MYLAGSTIFFSSTDSLFLVLSIVQLKNICLPTYFQGRLVCLSNPSSVSYSTICPTICGAEVHKIAPESTEETYYAFSYLLPPLWANSKTCFQHTIFATDDAELIQLLEILELVRDHVTELRYMFSELDNDTMGTLNIEKKILLPLDLQFSRRLHQKVFRFLPRHPQHVSEG